MDCINSFQICRKSSALDYLKGYWTKNLPLVNRLEKQLEVGFKKNLSSPQELYFKQAKSLLNCYELLILQFYEYCQALEIQDLGKCMLKIFIQVISIIDSIMKNFQDRQRRSKKNNCQSSHQNQSEQKKNVGRNKLSMTESLYFASRQKGRFEIKQMQQELLRVQQKYGEDIYQLDEKIMQTRKKVMDLQPSKAEFMIQQAFLEIEAKQNSLVNLTEFRNQRLQIDDITNFKKGTQLVFDEMENARNLNSVNVTQKLIQVVEKYLINKEKIRRNNLVNTQAQTDKKHYPPINQKAETQKLKKIQQVKIIEIKALKQELKQAKLKNELLQSNLNKNEEKFEEQLLLQRMKMKKLEQRASIVSKFSKSQYDSDLIIPEKTITHSVNSQMNISNVSNYSKNSIFNKEVQIITKKRTLSRRSNLSRARPSYDDLKRSQQPRRSQFKNQANKLTEKKVQKQNIQPNDQEEILQLSNIIEKQVEDTKIIQFDAESQTQFKEVKQKQIKEAQKTVKFRNQLKIKEQYSCYIGCFINGPPKYTQHNDIVFNEQLPTLLGKKTTANWPHCKAIRTLSKINQEQQYELKLTERSDSFEKLLVGNSFDSLSLNKKKSQDANTFEQKYKSKMKMPSAKLNFTQEDIENLFFHVEKALNYEYLNYNIRPYRNKNISVGILKSQKSWMSKSSQTLQENSLKLRAKSCHFMPKNTQNNDYGSITRYLSRHLKMIKSSCGEQYERLRNFLRYPYSAIYKSKQSKWRELSENQEEIDFYEIRRILNRLGKIHAHCEKQNDLTVCKHLEAFFHKIGLSFVRCLENTDQNQVRN